MKYIKMLFCLILVMVLSRSAYCAVYLGNDLSDGYSFWGTTVHLGANGIDHWASHSEAWYLSTIGWATEGFSVDDIEDQAVAAHNVWSSSQVSTTNLTFDYVERTTSTWGEDGICTIYMAQAGDPAYDGAPDYGPFFFAPNAGAITVFRVNANYEFIEADIIQNGANKTDWTLTRILWNLTHEVGHTIGLADLPDYQPETMSRNCSGDPSTLEADDVAGVSFLYGGKLTENTTLSYTDNYFNWDIEVLSGKTFTIPPGANITFNNSASLNIDGALVAQGTPASGIAFDFNSPNSSAQNGIVINYNSTASISYATISNAYRGIKLIPSSSSSTIQNNAILDCYDGIGIEYGGKDADLTISNNTIQDNTHYGISMTSAISGMNSEPSIANNTITGSGSHGIYLYNIGNLCSITGNSLNYNTGTGIAMYYSSPLITGNEINNNYNGVGCANSSTPSFGNSSYSGNNNIHDNYRGVYSLTSSSPFLGQEVPQIVGGNNIIANNSFKNLQAEDNGTILAEHNWWGADPPDANKIAALSGSTIDYDPWLDSPPSLRLAGGNTSIYTSSNTDVQMSVRNGTNGIIRATAGLQSGQELSGFNPNWSIIYKLLYAKKLVDDKQNENAQKILKDIILNNPDSSLSSYALSLLWEASRKDNPDTLKSFVSYIFEKNKDIDTYGLASIIRAFYDKGNKVVDLDETAAKYTSPSIKKMAIFGKFLYYMNEAKDTKAAEKVLADIDKRYPNSGISEDAHIQLGDSDNMIAKSGILETRNKVLSSSPKDYALSQNYPNPFNPTTTISYQIPKKGLVNLNVYDLLGREVANVVSGVKDAGYYNASFNGQNLSSGVYIYRLMVKPFDGSSEYTSTKKLMLLK